MPLNQWWKSGRKTRGRNEKAAVAALIMTTFANYFGGGVVVPPEFFLLFLPPLWCLFTILWPFFLPVPVVVPPPVWSVAALAFTPFRYRAVDPPNAAPAAASNETSP